MEHLVSHVSTLIEDKIKQTSISIAAIADYVIPKNQAENVSCNTTNQAENQHPTKKKKEKKILEVKFRGRTETEIRASVWWRQLVRVPRPSMSNCRCPPREP